MSIVDGWPGGWCGCHHKNAHVTALRGVTGVLTVKQPSSGDLVVQGDVGALCMDGDATGGSLLVAGSVQHQAEFRGTTRCARVSLQGQAGKLTFSDGATGGNVQVTGPVLGDMSLNGYWTGGNFRIDKGVQGTCGFTGDGVTITETLQWQETRRQRKRQVIAKQTPSKWTGKPGEPGRPPIEHTKDVATSKGTLAKITPKSAHSLGRHRNEP